MFSLELCLLVSNFSDWLAFASLANIFGIPYMFSTEWNGHLSRCEDSSVQQFMVSMERWLLGKTELLTIYKDSFQMRFEPPTSLIPEMAFPPFLLPRVPTSGPADFSVSSLLGQNPYLPLGGPGYPNAPKLGPYGHGNGGPPVSSEDIRSMRNMPADDDGVVDDPKVTLEGRDLWEKFHKLGTEMVITKSGRWEFKAFCAPFILQAVLHLVCF